MKTITIDITNRIAAARDRPKLVCGNKYNIDFVFDSEWDAETVKTARLTYNQNGKSKYDEFVFEGTSCEVTIAGGITEVNIGVYAGDLNVTTPARAECLKSILCGGGIHEEPPEDVYLQLLAAIKTGGGGGITEETDPTVHEWAKQPEKPTYTAKEVGALSMSDVTPDYLAYSTKPVNGIAVSKAIKQAKAYTDEKAVTVDQTYDAGSENAQSGVAVAKAVEDLKSDIYPQIIVNKGMIYTYSELIQSFPSNRISSIQFHTRGYAFSGSVTNIDLPSSGYVAFRIYDASSSICCIDVHRGELYKVDYIEHWNSSHSEVTYEVSVYCKTKELDSKLTTLENSLGDIDTALDNIIALQNSYIGGATE